MIWYWLLPAQISIIRIFLDLRTEQAEILMLVSLMKDMNFIYAFNSRLSVTLDWADRHRYWHEHWTTDTGKIWPRFISLVSINLQAVQSTWYFLWKNINNPGSHGGNTHSRHRSRNVLPAWDLFSSELSFVSANCVSRLLQSEIPKEAQILAL